MTSCSELRDLIGPWLEDELEPAAAAGVSAHLAGCRECAGLAETLRAMRDDAALVGSALEPPDDLAAGLAASPCQRWLCLLYRAVDHEISEAGLARLLTHLEGCARCRRAWNDLSLIHQAGEALAPPPGLAERLASTPRRVIARRVVGRRTATAAAYLLAVLTSLTIGNPVTLARVQAQRVADTVSAEVSEVAADGRGEARVILWRAWSFVERQVDLVRDAIGWQSSTDDRTGATDPEAAPDTPEGAAR